MSEEKNLCGMQRGMLLTLPGAALWSLPIGILGWRWFAPHVVSFEGMLQCAAVLAYFLVPMTAVCSPMAAFRLANGQDRIPPVANVVLLLFNLVTAVFCLFVIAIWFAAVAS